MCEITLTPNEEKRFNTLERRFGYHATLKAICLPFLHPEEPIFNWVIDSISHEELHYILDELEGFETNRKLDTLGYNFDTANIYLDYK